MRLNSAMLKKAARGLKLQDCATHDFVDGSSFPRPSGQAQPMISGVQQATISRCVGGCHDQTQMDGTTHD